jgi:hypothetical protein
VVKSGWSAEGIRTLPLSAETDLLMIKLRELSKKLISHDLSPAKYRLHLLAAITTLSYDELRALARLIADHNP